MLTTLQKSFQPDYDLPRMKDSKKEAEEATKELSDDDKKARDKACLESTVVLEHEGWNWDICWSTAKKFYEEKYRNEYQEERENENFERSLTE